MAPKKKGQKMDLSSFLADEATGGSWADEMDALPSGPSGAPVGEGGGLGGSHLTRNLGQRGGPDGGYGSQSRYDDRAPRAEVPIPTAPPYTAFVGNLSFETGEQDVSGFFTGLGVKSIRLVSGQDGKPRGFGYVEFETVDDLKNALTASGDDLAGRAVRISVAEAQTSRMGRADEASSWERTGPLPSLGGRQSSFASRGGFGDRAPQQGFEEVERDAPLRGGKFVPSAPAPQRGFSSYERAGRAPESEVERDAPLRGGKFVASAPAPERRMFSDREPSRADSGNWERRGPPAGAQERTGGFGSGFASRSGAEPPARRPLQLSARTASATGATTETSSGPSTPSSKPNPFGTARAVDTAAKDKENEEKSAKARAEAAAAQKEREAVPAPAPAAAAPKKEEPSRSEGAWVRKGPLPASQAGKNLPPPVPTVGGKVAKKDAPPHQQKEAKKEGTFSFANSAAALEEIDGEQ
ncbi:hypothetical protein JCM11641_001737 [Rhodosporidiobolus odoratus]